MKPYQITIIYLLFTLIACKPGAHKLPDSAFKKTLTTTQIPGLKYSIGLPGGYIIKKSKGPDFSVYYFYPADTTNTTGFEGGFYMGNNPALFPAANDSCKEQKTKAYLFGNNENWTLNDCNGKYQVQLITNSNSGTDWPAYIHAFGNCKSKAELDKLLEVYATLQKTD
jgi:hypothetical protein